MADTVTRRATAVRDTLAQVKALLGAPATPVTRDTLGRILAALKPLAAQHDLWAAADFPCADPVSKQNRYLLWEEPGQTLALYMIVWEPGKQIAPHDHTTWACIAGISGREENLLYERTDDRSVPGHSTLRLSGTMEVGAGDGIALMPDDIHGVRIMGDAPTRTLHLYGRPLEVLTERLSHDLEHHRYDVKSIGVTSIRALV